MLPFFVSGPLSKTLEHFRFLLSVLVGSAHVSRPTTHYSRIHRLNYLLHKSPHRSPRKGFFYARFYIPSAKTTCKYVFTFLGRTELPAPATQAETRAAMGDAIATRRRLTRGDAETTCGVY